MTDVNVVFLLSILIVAIGYLVKKLNILKETDGDTIARIIFNITLPAVILKFTATIQFELSLILLPLINIAFGFIMAFLAILIFRKYPPHLKGAMIMTMIGFNVANFFFPLVEGIWGQLGMQYIALVDAGNAFTIFILCYILSTIYSPKNQENIVKINVKFILKRLIRSAPLLSYIVAIIINFSGILIPSFFSELIDILASANTALALLLLGIFLHFKFKKAEWISIIKVLIVRYSVGLFVGLTLFFLLPPSIFNPLFRIIICLSLILPVGLAVIPFSVENGYDQKLVTMVVNLTIIISFGLIWVLILILNG
ncbi:MAG: AEC family transporter [Candidatus Lokiarchaeota archaeon]|nr:AEC family transporter [Candidatus Lokiarchaeota archaeon]